ncbi:MAG: tyrosine-type recombinase/integrase [Candidatus Dormiibacterota bacterium]
MPRPPLKIVKPDPSSDLESLVDDYLAHRRAEGLSPHTIALERAVLRQRFLPWCAAQAVKSPDQLDQRTIDDWQVFLLEEHRTPAGKPLSRESVRSYVRELSQFLKWAQKSEVVGAKVQAKRPSKEHRLLNVLSREEIKRLEDAATAERDKLIIRLLADTGVRLGELLGLRREDLLDQDRRERYIKVRGKGARDRRVPLTPTLFTRLRRYADHGRRGAASQRIFVTTRKSVKTGELEPLAARSVQNMITYAAQAAGIERPVYPHLFRHSFATHALRGKMNVVQLQNILGHADLTMISTVYGHLSDTDSYAAMLTLLRDED